MPYDDLPDEQRTATPVRGTRVVGVDAQGRDLTVVVRPPAEGKRRGRVRKRRTVLRVLGISVLVLVMVAGLGSVYFYRHLNDNLTVYDANGDILIAKPKAVIPPGPKGPQNILIMGSDTRCGAGNNIDGIGCDGARSDTTILIHLSGDHKRAYGISIPRDTLVDRPECKTKGGVAPAATNQMWNAAFSVGGAACTIAQVEQVTGIPIDHYVDVNFESFKTMVDALGGVQICLPEPVKDPLAQLDLPAGTQVISGSEALGYVRERHAIGDGSDLGRTRRQQAFIGSMVNKLLTAGTLSNPVKVVKFADAATKGLTLDPGLGNLQKIAGLAYAFRNIGAGHIQFLTAPTVGFPKGSPNWGREEFTSADTALWSELLHDQPLGKDLASQAMSAEDLPGQSSGKASSSSSSTPSDSPSGKATGKSSKTSKLTDAQKSYMQYYGLCSGS